MGLRHSQAIRGIARARKTAEKLDGREPKRSWGQKRLEEHGLMHAVLLLVGKGKTYHLIESAIKKDPYTEERVELYISAIRGFGGGSHVKGLLRALNVSNSKEWVRQRAVEHSTPSSARSLTSRFIQLEHALDLRLKATSGIDMRYFVDQCEKYDVNPERALAILDRVKLKHRMENLRKSPSK